MSFSGRIILVVICLTFLNLGSILATTPFPNTGIFKKNGQWQYNYTGLLTRDLVLVDEDQGTQQRLDIEDLFPGKDYHICVNDSTAGPIWGRASLAFLFKNDNDTYFYLHHWAGKKLFVNLDSGKIEDPQPFASQLAKEERNQIQSRLKDAVRGLARQDGPSLWEAIGPMLLAAQQGMKEVREDLENIEKLDPWSGPIPRWGKDGFAAGLGPEFSDGMWHIFELRTVAKLTLRRLGYAPQGYPQINYSQWKIEKYIISPEKAISSGEQLKNVTRLKKGMPSEKVYQMLGFPDYIEWPRSSNKDLVLNQEQIWRNAWRYDFGPEPDCSLLVIWDGEEGAVRRVEKITPGLWHGDELFDDGIEKPIFDEYGFNREGNLLYSKHFRGKIEVLESKAADVKK